MSVRVQLHDGSVFEVPLTEATTVPQRQMFLIRSADNNRVYEVNAWAIKNYIPYRICLHGTKRILDAHREDRFFGKFVYGDLRSGKSVYALHLLSEVYGETWEERNILYNIEDEYALPVYICKKPNWFAYKEHMVFLPSQFDTAHEKVVNAGLDSGEKERLLVWDDAGVWLNKRDYTKEWAKDLIRQVQVIGSAFTSIIFTSPNYEELLKGIREIPGFRWGAPTIHGFDHVTNPFLRAINIYTTKIIAGKKFVKKEYEDRYGKVEQEAFNSYQAMRRRYLMLMYDEIKKKTVDSSVVDAILEGSDSVGVGGESGEFRPNVLDEIEVKRIEEKPKQRRKRLAVENRSVKSWRDLYKSVVVND